MRSHKSPSISLFEQLGAGIDILGQVPVPKAHRYAEDAAQGEIAPSEVPAEALQTIPENITDMKFTHSLIKHLDMLYNRMLAGEISDINDQQQDPEIKEIAGLPMIEKNSYYNSGNSNVTESF